MPNFTSSPTNGSLTVKVHLWPGNPIIQNFRSVQLHNEKAATYFRHYGVSGCVTSSFRRGKPEIMLDLLQSASADPSLANVGVR
jgi:hypothetical protein